MEWTEQDIELDILLNERRQFQLLKRKNIFAPLYIDWLIARTENKINAAVEHIGIADVLKVLKK